MTLTRLSSLLILLASLVVFNTAVAQSSLPATSAKELYNEIRKADSLAFAALNAHNVSQLMAFFTKDVEFYNDGATLTTYDQTSVNFGNMFKGTPDIRRELINGSLEVYPVKGYGAIAVGAHRFCHKENGREDCGTFKFTTIWQKKDGEWKMSRVVSYGH